MLDIQQIRTSFATYQPITMLPNNNKQAAVAMLLRDNGGTTEVLLIRRAEHEADPWSGDLGFPGGRIEATDTSTRAAAERETWEEIGITLTEQNYLGQSDDLTGAYLEIHISCFVYIVNNRAQFNKNHEVEDLFWVPVETLLDPKRNQQKTFFFRGKDHEHPIINLKEWSARPLWGITYRLIDNFLQLFDLGFTYKEQFSRQKR